MIKYIIYLAPLLLLIVSCKQTVNNVNTNASIQKNDELSENPLLMIPITSSIQPKDSTMSTLYGNKIAAEYAKKNDNSSYPQGSALYEVTWKQKPDEVWYGGNVPEKIISVEKVVFEGHGIPMYEIYKGKPLKKIASKDQLIRTKFIISQKMAVSP